MIEIKGKIHDACKLKINPGVCHEIKPDKVSLLVLGRTESATTNLAFLLNTLAIMGKE